MAGTEFEEFIKNEIDSQKGVCHPARAGMLERLFVMKTSITKLHPNPDDEFCFPDIGPNYGIISDYSSKFLFNIKHALPVMEEPLMIQKIRPHGYMILNGHHRWAAARRIGLKRVPVRIVNTTSESDIRQMLESTAHDMRATFDLDEVIFRPADDPHIEKKPGFIRFGIQRKALRAGIPALFSWLVRNGYDVWVYSSNFYSTDDIARYFRRYQTPVTGIITGMKKKKSGQSTVSDETRKLMENKYQVTVHIDNDLVLVTRGRAGEFEEKEIESDPGQWSRQVISILEEMSGR